MKSTVFSRAMSDRKVALLNVPNVLTTFRIILVPAYVVALLYDEYGVALGIFVAASVTDVFDGWIARLTNQMTYFGAVLDPIADKVLLMSSFILFAILKWIPLWLVVTVLSRDIIVMAGTVILYLTTGVLTVSVNRAGKVSTVLQVVLLGYCLLNAALLGTVDRPLWLYVPVFAASVMSGIQYVIKGLELANAPSSNGRPDHGR